MIVRNLSRRVAYDVEYSSSVVIGEEGVVVAVVIFLAVFFVVAEEEDEAKILVCVRGANENAVVANNAVVDLILSIQELLAANEWRQ